MGRKKRKICPRPQDEEIRACKCPLTQSLFLPRSLFSDGGGGEIDHRWMALGFRGGGGIRPHCLLTFGRRRTGAVGGGGGPVAGRVKVGPAG